jgi:hypothetical protein
MQETENTEGTVKFKRMEFNTIEWSAEKVEKLCKRLESDGYNGNLIYKNPSSISTYLDGWYECFFAVAVVDRDFLTTYEEYMGEKVKDVNESISVMREVVLTHDTVSIDSVRESKLYGVEGAMSKEIIYQVNSFYSYSSIRSLNVTKFYDFNTLEDVIRHCVKQGYKVYEFDNSEDLLHWLLEK